MKILICSDSHNNNEALDKLVLINPNMDLYLHAGDSESEEHSIRPFESVKGNCDYFSSFPEKRIITTPFGNLLIQHKPRFDNTFLIENNIKIIVFGHTHVRHQEIINGRYYFNPGAISFSRDGNELSYLILEIDDKDIKFKFKSLLDK